MTDSATLLGDGQDALRRGAWEDGRALFSAALEHAETAEAYDGLATCCRFIGALDESLAARERAYRLFRERGDAAGATIAAAWLGRDSAIPRGELSVARGWFAVARRHLARTDSALARGTLSYYEGQFTLLGEVDAPRAGELGAEARAAGRECGDLDLEMQGLSLEGLAYVAEGRVDEGMGLIEEAAAAVLGDELSGADVAGWICCHLVYACERVSDIRRADEWCANMRVFCERWEMPGMFGMCLTHHGSVLMHAGRWEEAEAEITEGAQHFAAAAPALGYEAAVRLAELRRRQGRLAEVDELATLLEQSPLRWFALLPRAWMALENDELDEAVLMLDRYFEALAPRDRMMRTEGLELAVQIHVARRDLIRAATAADALAELAADAGTDRLAGAAALARGRTLSSEGRHVDARHELEKAVDLQARASAPFDEATARAALADSLLALGETRAAAEQLRVAGEIFERLGASLDLARVKAAISGDREPHGSILSARELEVLRLAAEGESNASIGEKLHISPHTVHRHLANIRTKLGADSKAAIVARAIREGLL